MKIPQKIQAALDEGRKVFSFEYFPPKTADGVENLFDRMDRMVAYQPAFCDITWGAGGSTADLTLEIATRMQNNTCVETSIHLTCTNMPVERIDHALEHIKNLRGEICVETSMHLTCTNMPVERIDHALEHIKAAGLQNVLALRGDPPHGQDKFVAAEGGFSCALDLVKHIRAKYGDYFGITVAGYPEAHPDAISGPDGATPEEYQKDLEYLKAKMDAGADLIVTQLFYDVDIFLKFVLLPIALSPSNLLLLCMDAGADLIVTQLFYDVDIFLKFVADCRAMGVSEPIIPGIMPITTYGGFKRMTAFCKTKVPQSILDALEPIKDNEEAVRAYGIQQGTEMCRRILDAGIHTLHMYTLNQDKTTIAILKVQLGTRPPSPFSRCDLAGCVLSVMRVGVVGRDVGIHTLYMYTLNRDKTTIAILKDKTTIAILKLSLVGVGNLGLIEASNIPRALPWRSATNIVRCTEDVRPIYWSLRPKSYLARTASRTKLPSGRLGPAEALSLRPKSYLARTAAWTKFPSGRLGPAEALSYSDLPAKHRAFLKRKSRATALARDWAVPVASTEDVKQLFARFVSGEVSSFPWSEAVEASLSADSAPISAQLQELNAAGLLTINSQPAVNGAKSDDPVLGECAVLGAETAAEGSALSGWVLRLRQKAALLEKAKATPSISLMAVNSQGIMCLPRAHVYWSTLPVSPSPSPFFYFCTPCFPPGWGGPGGYIYQKAYVECFAPHDKVTTLLEKAKATPSISLMAVNSQGHVLATGPGTPASTTPFSANAVTWGVFPGREVVQPTVADFMSFLAWKEEAFGAWVDDWAGLYKEEDEGTPLAKKLLQEIHDTYYLVSVVDNDYVSEPPSQESRGGESRLTRFEGLSRSGISCTRSASSSGISEGICGGIYGGHATGARRINTRAHAPPPVFTGEQWTTAHAFTAAEVAAFAHMTGDLNPIHLDARAAEAAGFAECVVHGILAASLFPALIAKHHPGAIYVSQTLRFLAPVHVGEQVTATVEAISVVAHRHRFRVTFASKAFKTPRVTPAAAAADAGTPGEAASPRPVLALDGIAVAIIPPLNKDPPKPMECRDDLLRTGLQSL
ncbi:unnamed protein product [Closterium sp. NIES-65]|nr:unnamed protein product [Closterium sp. NIES-65]